ncbi:SDR family oxidoreductase [Pseudoroseicyclus tamaricis]|uniref:SDR family oxidoreductase n=1 Tax=Pseudoroseicyclus tamaricis TaxID=2705421 RepID=A0A6B2JW18_9RHOB|nr:SDR family oxidoreductase [Pseudoroseicyclus tamaricis]NDU99581.1 SDR family oxidoreductase [Pseudoroseicyclus tamaricis]
MIGVTGATGQLGGLVIEELLKRVSPGEIVALVRDEAKARPLADKGVAVRLADYDKPETLAPAFEGLDKLLLISGSEVGRRGPQHEAVIKAAEEAGVGELVYTSLYQLGEWTGERATILSREHQATEDALAASSLNVTLLRNSWYFENYAQSLQMGAEHGSFIGANVDAPVAAAPRSDYAEAAAIVLTREGHTGKTYELAGDDGFTMPELAEIASEASGKTIAYNPLPQEAYAKALEQVGLPTPVAEMLAASDASIGEGVLAPGSKDLSTLLGRPTTPVETSVRQLFS